VVGLYLLLIFAAEPRRERRRFDGARWRRVGTFVAGKPCYTDVYKSRESKATRETGTGKIMIMISIATYMPPRLHTRFISGLYA
jgi:hypothetical protein